MSQRDVCRVGVRGKQGAIPRQCIRPKASQVDESSAVPPWTSQSQCGGGGQTTAREHRQVWQAQSSQGIQVGSRQFPESSTTTASWGGRVVEWCGGPLSYPKARTHQQLVGVGPHKVELAARGVDAEAGVYDPDEPVQASVVAFGRRHSATGL